MPNNDKNNYKDRYSVNESLLQSYRQIFISAASFLLAVGIFAADKDDPNPGLFLTIVIMNLIIIIWMWFPIVATRAKLVDFFKFKIYDDPDEITQEDYVKNPEVRKKANQDAIKRKEDKAKQSAKIDLDLKALKKGPWRGTRKKIDFFLPLFFIVVWLILLWTYEGCSIVSVLIIDIAIVSAAIQGIREYIYLW